MNHDEFRKAIIEKTMKTSVAPAVEDTNDEVTKPTKGGAKIIETSAADMLSKTLEKQAEIKGYSTEDADKQRKKILEATKGAEKRVGNLMKGFI